jgi:hypothetical protein
MPDSGLRLTRTHTDLLRQIGRGERPRAGRSVAILRTLGLVNQQLQLTKAGMAVIEKQPKPVQHRVRLPANKTIIASGAR